MPCPCPCYLPFALQAELVLLYEALAQAQQEVHTLRAQLQAAEDQVVVEQAVSGGLVEQVAGLQQEAVELHSALYYSQVSDGRAGGGGEGVV